MHTCLEVKNHVGLTQYMCLGSSLIRHFITPHKNQPHLFCRLEALISNTVSLTHINKKKLGEIHPD